MAKRKLTPFGIKTKQRLIALDVTHKDLAKHIGISIQYLYDIMYGGRYAEKRQEEISAYLDELEAKQKIAI